MKERPILVSSEMVRAILDDRKSQTRRVIKPQPILHNNCNGQYFGWKGHSIPARLFANECLYGVPGDLLWVRETWADTSFDWEYGTKQEAVYRATDIEYPGPWRPSIFMPRWASRITLKIINVRVERLQEITYEDAVAEGTPGIGLVGANILMLVTGTNNLDDAEKKARIDSFAELWDSINIKNDYPWSNNPWVWVIEFERTNP